MDAALFAAHHDLEQRHWWFRARREAIRQLGLTLISPGSTIVDVGCGTGADLAIFPRTFERFGIDESEEAIQLARSRFRDIEFDVGTVPRDGAGMIVAADLILLCDVLEHVEGDAAFLRALVGLMKPEAHLLITVPADPRLWSPHDEAYGHWRRYTEATFSNLLDGLPVAVRLLAPFNRRLYPLARLVRFMTSSRGKGWGAAETDLAMPPPFANRLLERIFVSEVPGLRAALDGEERKPAGRGVSLIAVLRRLPIPEEDTSQSVQR